jgi:hypothetical protein
MNNPELARTLLIIGSSIYFALGAAHALATIVDVFRPTFFAPTDRKLIEPLKHAPVQLAAWFGRKSYFWSAWLGFNISHSIGGAFFGLCFLLVGLYRFDLFQSYWVVPTLAISMGVAYLIVALCFWFFVPATGITIGLLCFIASAVLA